MPLCSLFYSFFMKVDCPVCGDACDKHVILISDIRKVYDWASEVKKKIGKLKEIPRKHTGVTDWFDADVLKKNKHKKVMSSINHFERSKV